MKTLREKYNDLSVRKLMGMNFDNVDPNLRRRIIFIETHIMEMEQRIMQMDYDQININRDFEYEINKLKYPNYDG